MNFSFEAALKVIALIQQAAPLVLSGIDEGRKIVADIITKGKDGTITDEEFAAVHANIARLTARILRPLDRNE